MVHYREILRLNSLNYTIAKAPIIVWKCNNPAPDIEPEDINVSNTVSFVWEIK